MNRSIWSQVENFRKVYSMAPLPGNQYKFLGLKAAQIFLCPHIYLKIEKIQKETQFSHKDTISGKCIH